MRRFIAKGYVAASPWQPIQFRQKKGRRAHFGRALLGLKIQLSQLLKPSQHLHSFLWEIARHVFSYLLFATTRRKLMPASFSVHPDLGQEILVPVAVEN